MLVGANSHHKGHRSSRSTEIYAHSSAQREREAVDMLPQSRSVRGVGA